MLWRTEHLPAKVDPDTSARALRPVLAAERSLRGALRIHHHATQGAGRRRVRPRSTYPPLLMSKKNGLCSGGIRLT
ncbi:hypothetical protein PVAP13_9KG102300 [Panicum virgatum]|uniref:Uncharacterized protein n=1 Tax=Panicum virgatum TaxID=38727 RepID=A0A8T0NEB6_PANVG|nr:hypothetical protein PVAP13_9KG102300 [Panicum virgatum]